MPTATISPAYIHDVDACAEAILSRVGKRIVLGLPVGIGKPNLLVNALTRRAIDDKSIHLGIFTALSLRRPRGRSELERRFIEPFAARVFGDYPELEYVRLLERGVLPSNIEVSEFFLEPGAWLSNAHLQQNYLSANYTHVARDLQQRGLNVVAQLVSPPPPGAETYSLGSNPDLTADLLPYFREQRARGKPCVLVGQVHRKLPYMYGDAEVAASDFDLILDQPDSERALFCPPNMPIGTTDYAIAMNVSTLVRDGGTLQLGIGELGDAIVYGLKLRHEQPVQYQSVLKAAGIASRYAELIASVGGMQTFASGVYGCSEMLVDGFLDLHRAGILKRRVYPHALLQRALNNGALPLVNEALVQALHASGLEQLTARDFRELQLAGVFRDDVEYREGNLHTPSGVSIQASFETHSNRQRIAAECLGSTLRNGVLAHGGFFFGPAAFYEALRAMPEEERKQFAMQRISFINELYGDDQALKVAQRRDARFINTTMMITALGAAVSDGLSSGQVVSGVGGQYNFVAMAHALPDARSILCLRSTRTSKGRVDSNVVWNYAHTTIPRHLRDIVVTEYGIADLRGRTDREVIEAMVRVTDARFQDGLVAEAKRHGKLPAEYRVPDVARQNLPQSLEALLAPWRKQGLFGELPFGGEFTATELVLAKALRSLQIATGTKMERTKLLLRALTTSPNQPHLLPYLQRMELATPQGFSEDFQRRVVALAVSDVLANQ
ncbi:MAG: hypothetical protein H7Y02_12225 [Candidatus Obscuribacterales bacterium]|nr:hypothetical protein [Steroidobacteraceae bacterium]